MEYNIKEITLRNKHQQRTRLIIEFQNPTYAILGELLMIDAPLLQWRIIKDIESVLAQRSEVVEYIGNRTKAIIRIDETEISDLFTHVSESDGRLQTVTIETTELLALLCMWQQKVGKH